MKVPRALSYLTDLLLWCIKDEKTWFLSQRWHYTGNGASWHIHFKWNYSEPLRSIINYFFHTFSTYFWHILSKKKWDQTELFILFSDSFGTFVWQKVALNGAKWHQTEVARQVHIGIVTGKSGLTQMNFLCPFQTVLGHLYDENGNKWRKVQCRAMPMSVRWRKGFRRLLVTFTYISTKFWPSKFDLQEH